VAAPAFVLLRHLVPAPHVIETGGRQEGEKGDREKEKPTGRFHEDLTCGLHLPNTG
jgi:hypothetical protein